MSKKASQCPHVICVGGNTWEHVQHKKANQDTCQSCGITGPNLWLCLHSQCLYVGCGESGQDHSSAHGEGLKHCLTLNLTTMRIWCYTCESEVFKDNNNPPLFMPERTLASSASLYANQTLPLRVGARTPTQPSTPEESSDEDDENQKPRGLTGLQNVGNTCYMNAALQALSNCPPLTRFFLDCPGYVVTDKKPQLAKSYSRLMSEMWHRKRPGCVMPSSIAHGIKSVHPMFRGFMQQDTQEFLRCFMDQLHEELKHPIMPDILDTQPEDMECEDSAHSPHQSTVDEDKEDIGPVSAPIDTPAQSDTDYETCESGISSERSSVENSISGDENLDSADPKLCDQNKSNNSSVVMRGKKDKNHIPADDDSVSSRPDSGISSLHSDSSLCQKTAKEIKDSVNMANQQLSNEACNVPSPQISNETPMEVEDVRHSEMECTEFTDAVSELEPLQGQKIKSSPPSSVQRLRHLSDGSSVSNRSASPQSCVHISGGSRKKPEQFTSVISDIFDGKLLSSVQCLTCERISSTKETFQDLSLPIPSKDHIHMLHASHMQGPITHKGTCGEVTLNQGWFHWMFGWVRSWFWGPIITLQDCLSAFFSADELKGDNMYSCEKCKKLRNGVKYSKVMEMSEVLCIHLKRFRHEFMFSSKISSYVAFPMENLDMSPYKHKDCKDQVTMYDLVAIICHHGTAGGGHYTSYALNYINEQWYEFDDNYVTEVDVQTVENCEAYVLFYRKKNDRMQVLRQRAEEIITNTESSIMKFWVSKQWLNKFNTFAEPGPITNNDFLCRHGGVPPSKWPYVNDLAMELVQPAWEFLHEEFGGGPAVNHIYQCTTCLQEIEKLKKRQKYEIDAFVQLNSEFQNEESPSAIYGISMSWFKEWENFVKARTDEPPGPIDNSKISVVKNGVAAVRPSSDYGQLSEEMWSFLFEIYGGGPEVVLKQTPTLAQLAQESHKVNDAGDTGVKTPEPKTS